MFDSNSIESFTSFFERSVLYPYFFIFIFSSVKNAFFIELYAILYIFLLKSVATVTSVCTLVIEAIFFRVATI